MKYIWKLTHSLTDTEAYYTTRKALLLDNAEELPPEMPGPYALDRHDWSKPWKREFIINKEAHTVCISRHRVNTLADVKRSRNVPFAEGIE
jgi:hypothetical protein